MRKSFALSGIFCSLFFVTSFVGCTGEVLDSDNLSVDESGQALKGQKDKKYHRVVKEGEFVSANDDMIRYKEYKKKGHVEAYVIFLNGRTEFLEKYDALFTSLDEMPWETTPEQTLADLPITFYAIDHAGQGESEGMRSHIDDYATFTAGVSGLINHVKNLRKHKKPIYLMGRSMGGLIAARFAQENPEVVDGLILSSPMLGMNPPPGVTLEQLQQLAAGYAAPAPYGFGMAERCARAVDPTILGMLGMCLTDATGTCPSCMMGDDTAPVCANFPLDWDGMRSGWGLLNSDVTISCEAITVRNPEYSCTFPGEGFNGTSSDYDYCFWMESNPIAGPAMTFGWLYESFEAIDKLFLPENLDKIRHIPTLILSSPIDPIVSAPSHGAFCSEMDDCQLVEFTTNWETGPFYFHELLAEVDRASVIDEIRTFLDVPCKKHGKKHGKHNNCKK